MDKNIEPQSVHGFRDLADGEDSWYSGEPVAITGMMELQTPGKLILHSDERGDVLIQYMLGEA